MNNWHPIITADMGRCMKKPRRVQPTTRLAPQNGALGPMIIVPRSRMSICMRKDACRKHASCCRKTSWARPVHWQQASRPTTGNASSVKCMQRCIAITNITPTPTPMNNLRNVAYRVKKEAPGTYWFRVRVYLSRIRLHGLSTPRADSKCDMVPEFPGVHEQIE